MYKYIDRSQNTYTRPNIAGKGISNRQSSKAECGGRARCGGGRWAPSCLQLFLEKSYNLSQNWQTKALSQVELNNSPKHAKSWKLTQRPLYLFFQNNCVHCCSTSLIVLKCSQINFTTARLRHVSNCQHLLRFEHNYYIYGFQKCWSIIFDYFQRVL